MFQKSLVDDMMIMMNTEVERLIDFYVPNSTEEGKNSFSKVQVRLATLICPFPLAFSTKMLNSGIHHNHHVIYQRLFETSMTIHLNESKRKI